MQFVFETDAVAARHGLTARQYVVLLTLRASPDRRLTVSALQEHLFLGQSATTELLDRAEGAGLLVRRVDPRDRRVRWVEATPEGERRLLATFTALRRQRRELAETFLRAGELVRKLADGAG